MARHDILTPDLEIGMVAAPLDWPRWPEAKAMLHPALMAGDEDWPEIERDLVSNDKQLWAVLAKGGDPDLLAAAVTRVAASRRGRIAEVYLVGGRGFRRWIGPLNDTIEASARDIGCVAMRAYGRFGWRDVLRALGWRPSFVGYEKVL